MNEIKIYEDMIVVLETHRQVLQSEIDNYENRIKNIESQKLSALKTCTMCGKEGKKRTLCEECGARC